MQNGKSFSLRRRTITFDTGGGETTLQAIGDYVAETVRTPGIGSLLNLLATELCGDELFYFWNGVISVTDHPAVPRAVSTNTI